MNKTQTPRKKRIAPGTGKVERRKGSDGTPWVKSFTPVGLQTNPKQKRWANSDAQYASLLPRSGGKKTSTRKSKT